MSTAQEQVIRHVMNMSDVDARFILEIIERLISKDKTAVNPAVSDKMKAFQKLETLRGGFPTDFDPDKELAEARDKKYGNFN